MDVCAWWRKTVNDGQGATESGAAFGAGNVAVLQAALRREVGIPFLLCQSEGKIEAVAILGAYSRAPVAAALRETFEVDGYTRRATLSEHLKLKDIRERARATGGADAPGAPGEGAQPSVVFFLNAVKPDAPDDIGVLFREQDGPKLKASLTECFAAHAKLVHVDPVPAGMRVKVVLKSGITVTSALEQEMQQSLAELFDVRLQTQDDRSRLAQRAEHEKQVLNLVVGRILGVATSSYG